MRVKNRQEIKLADKKHVFFHNVSITELDLSNNQIDPQKMYAFIGLFFVSFTYFYILLDKDC